MTAGVVNYKLCEYEFKCETCEFDKAMRGVISEKENCFCLHHSDKSAAILINSETQNEDRINQFLSSLLQNCKLHLDRFYHFSHFWIQCKEEDMAVLGIDNLILKLLHPIDKIILPEVNTSFQRDQLVALIIKKQHMFPLHLPIPGRVSEINTDFLDKQLHGESESDPFLFKLKHPEITKDKIFSEGKIGGFHTIRCKIELLAYYLRQLLREKFPDNIGITLADGGTFENDLEKILGEDNYKNLLNDLQHR
jgi:glycine cleavage system H lipoate-binding protein